MNKVYTLLILTIVIAGAVGSSSKAQLKSLLQAKSNFIPDRCEVDDATSCEEDYFGIATYPLSCVCFSNGTCEMRSDKSRCQWCVEERAESVNENQRCPDLNGGLLRVCPKKSFHILPVYDPVLVDPIPVEEPVKPIKPIRPILIAKPEPAILVAEPEPTIGIAEPAVLIAEPEATIGIVEPAILIAEPEPEISVIEAPEMIICYFPAPQPEIFLPPPEILIAEPEAEPAILVAEPEPTVGIAEPEATIGIVEPAVLIAEPEPAIRVAKPVRAILKPAPEILIAEPEPAILVADVPESDYPILIASTDSVAKSSKLSPLVRPLPISPPIKVKPTKGCICTEDGVCTKAKISDWKSECEDDRVVAVVEDGACPKSAPIKYKAPEDAKKCTKADRTSGRMCPMYISLTGCVCTKNGCENQGTNLCSGCFNPDVISISTTPCAWQ